MGKKKFLNRKNSATFTLVYRDTAGEEDSAIPIRQFTRVDGGDSYVPGFTEDDPLSRPVDVDEDSDEENVGDGDDSRFDDADEESGDEEAEEEAGPAKRSWSKIAVNKAAGSRGLTENVRQELIELGFPDDGYDYNQHMRNVGAAFVPSSRVADPLRADLRAYDSSKVDVQPVHEIAEAPPSGVIELVSSGTRAVRKLLSKDGVLDTDVIAALDNSDGSQFDSADELEDEFVIFASEHVEGQASGLVNHGATTSGCLQEGGGASQKQRLDKVSDNEGLFEDEGNDELQELPGRPDRERPIRLLDEQFETLASHEYDDFDDGELDEDDPFARGHADISQFSSVLSDFLNDKELFAEKYETIADSHQTPAAFDSTSHDRGSDSIGGKAANTNMVVNRGVGDIIVKKTLELGGYESEGEVVALSESEADRDEWDCETVVSTYSNLDNHPAKISAPGTAKSRPKLQDLEKAKIIRLSGKQHLPLDYLPGKVVDGKQDGKPVGKEAPPSGKVAGRRAGETLEDKKARKASIKENRREARLAKKTMKLYYRDESHRAQHGAATMGPNAIHLP